MGETRTRTRTRTADMHYRVAAALTNKELTNVLDLLFRRIAAAEAEIVVLLGELNRSEASFPPAQRT